MPHQHRHKEWRDRTAPHPDAEFDALHRGREVLPAAPVAAASEVWNEHQEPGDGQEGVT